MGVLKNVGGGWRLFWVLQVIGSSFGLAVLVVKLTGNGDTVSGGDRCESGWATFGCSIYGWFFILNGYPLAVTAFSLLATRSLSRPLEEDDQSVEPARGLVARTLRRNRLCFSLALACWVCYRFVGVFLFVPQDYSLASTAVGGTALIAGGFALSCGCGSYCRRLKTACARGNQRFRPVDRRRRRLLFRSGLLLIVARGILDGVDHHGSPSESELYQSVVEPARDVLEACYAVFDSVVDAWLLFGMGLADLKSPSVLVQGADPSRPLSSVLWPMLAGCCLFEAYFALNHLIVIGVLDFVDRDWFWSVYPAFNVAGENVRLMWRITVGTLLWGWTREVRAVAYWLAANGLIWSFTWCTVIVVNAALDSVVT